VRPSVAKVENTRAPSSFTPEQAAEVIREATELSLQNTRGSDAHLAYDDVLTMAKELGLDQAALDQALQVRERKEAEQKRLAAEDRAQRDRTQLRLGRFLNHVGSYATVVGGLALLNLVTGGRWWVKDVAFWWGFGLAMHGFGTLRRVLRDTARR